jgi:hypothetical protein
VWLQNAGRLNVVLRPVVAGFAAVGAVVLTVFGEPDAKFRMAKGAVSVALAALFRLIADRAKKDFPRHRLVLHSPAARSRRNCFPVRTAPFGGPPGAFRAAGAANSVTRHRPPTLLIGNFNSCAQSRCLTLHKPHSAVPVAINLAFVTHILDPFPAGVLTSNLWHS